MKKSKVTLNEIRKICRLHNDQVRLISRFDIDRIDVDETIYNYAKRNSASMPALR